MKHWMFAVVVFVVACARAEAAPLTVVEIEVERDKLGYLAFFDTLPSTDVEPGGLLVTKDAGPHWFAIGLKVGDVIRYFDSAPAAGDRMLVRDGLNLLEIDRKGRRMLLRVMVRGPAKETTTLKETDFQDMLKKLAGPDPQGTAVMKRGVPTGVRVTNMLLDFELDLAVGDIVRTIDGKPIVSNAELVAALQGLRVGQTDIVVDRHGRKVVIEITRQAPVSFSTIKKVSATRYEVPKAIADAIDNDVWLLRRKVDSVPVISKGTVRGVRLYNIEADSLVAALGFQNDDIVMDVGGHSIATMEDAFGAARQLANATTIVVNVQRDGARMQITYAIK